MTTYQDLRARLDRGGVVILDGATGTELQTGRAHARHRLERVEMGAQIIGGCCAIGPEYIRLLRERLAR
jgi:S-methylmethionine-dependent homocysteine/selenocysteine methylase